MPGERRTYADAVGGDAGAGEVLAPVTLTPAAVTLTPRLVVAVLVRVRRPVHHQRPLL